MVSHVELCIKCHAQALYSVVWKHSGATNRQQQTVHYVIVNKHKLICF